MLADAFAMVDFAVELCGEGSLEVDALQADPEQDMDLSKDANASQAQLQKEALPIIKSWPLAKGGPCGLLC